ncbi:MULTISPECIES: LysR substrate-binding domain-containing protein [Inquilinus]|uniref:LysR family glycine cleavage system transcriptional activator n=1 Tax=Inquilinus ginsengisoli TaxID=363840 RepID=A0ABU1JZ91_9PROT|nr:LysR substrate-binding domain-containing protein [Inquilinus ginsengisoli]MDR6293928.1 LysR family glycine cleavage system transcriptional activator [Inquilinus ginsengisoli]
MQRLPLGPLRTFDLAARHESFARAAQALHLTDSAVSHQMRRLEAAVGFALFERRGRRVVLTNAGREFHRTVHDSLETMAAAAAELASRAGEAAGPLAIGAPPMFASKWLAPRLAEFARSHPAIECTVRVVDNDAVAAAEADIGIAFGSGPWPGRWSRVLAEVALSPACSPRLFGDRGGVIPDPAALGEVPLLHQDDGTEWRRWFAAAGVKPPAAGRQMHFSDISVAIDVALHGGGMVLASDVLSSQHVRDGTLVRPFPTRIAADGQWCVLCDPRRIDLPAIRVFLAWLTAQFEAPEPRPRPRG